MRVRLIENVTLIDGRGGPARERMSLLVEGETIRTITGHESSALEDVERIDAAGCTVIPGIIDCHAHVTFEVESAEAQMRRPLSLNFYNSVRYMRKMLDAGITTVRDAGGADLGTKLAVERGIVPGPRLQISISPLSPTGGHFDQRFPVGVSPKPPAYPGRPYGVCDGVEEVRKRVREVLHAGADVIKICTTGGVLSPSDRHDYTQFSPEEIAVCVQEAAYRGERKVMAHAIGTEGIRNAILAGVHSIEHGAFIDDECIELMLERGTYLVPTLTALVGIIEKGERTGALAPDVLAKAHEIKESHTEALARAREAGVSFAFGTDASVFPHEEALRELELLGEIGMSPMDALVSATKTSAECLGWGERLGTLEEGKLADLVICRRDPIADIASLQDPDNILLVMKGGEIMRDSRAAS
jgi:imidazolonepropionase-like amidohydrolase